MRNQFAHGDWVELANEIRGLDLDKAFEGTAKLMEHFQTNLQRIRPHEYYKVTIVGKWQGEKDERLVEVWKFLVQVPESLQSSHHSAAAMAAREVGGSELRKGVNFLESLARNSLP